MNQFSNKSNKLQRLDYFPYFRAIRVIVGSKLATIFFSSSHYFPCQRTRSLIDGLLKMGRGRKGNPYGWAKAIKGKCKLGFNRTRRSQRTNERVIGITSSLTMTLDFLNKWPILRNIYQDFKQTLTPIFLSWGPSPQPKAKLKDGKRPTNAIAMAAVLCGKVNYLAINSGIGGKMKSPFLSNSELLFPDWMVPKIYQNYSLEIG